MLRENSKILHALILVATVLTFVSPYALAEQGKANPPLHIHDPKVPLPDYLRHGLRHEDILEGLLYPDSVLPNALPGGFSPAQIRHAYGFDQITFSNGTVAGDGTGQTIAIIDAYDQPTIASDLQVFDSMYGIQAPPSFTKVNQTGGTTYPAANQNWGLEISLDVEWAHAIAPGASILLVEATTNSWSDLFTAVNYAKKQPGVSVVSMSFGGSEWSSETAYDGYFSTPSGHSGVSFVASSGDAGSSAGPEYPAVSANVLAVGGTQLATDSLGTYVSETGWSGSGGGISSYVTQPGYQAGVVTQSSTKRASPDVAYNGSSTSPFAVYDFSGYGGWIQVYGTSAGAPQWASLIAIANQGRTIAGRSTLNEFTSLDVPYAFYDASPAPFIDVATGNNGFQAGPGYDLVTGLGSPLAPQMVEYLVAYDSAVTPTPLPTSTPTVGPTSTPKNTPTPAPTRTPSNTPTPAPTKTPRPVHKK
jgi:subtilase family serine protease